MSIDDMRNVLEMAGLSFIKSPFFDIWYASRRENSIYWSSRVSLEDCIEGAWREYVNDAT